MTKALSFIALTFLVACQTVPAYTDGDKYLYAKSQCGLETTEYQACIDYYVERIR